MKLLGFFLENVSEYNKASLKAFMCALFFPKICEISFGEQDNNGKTKITVKIRDPSIPSKYPDHYLITEEESK